MGAGPLCKSQHNYTCNSVALSHHNLPGFIKQSKPTWLTTFGVIGLLRRKWISDERWAWGSNLNLYSGYSICQAIISDRIFPKPEKLNCLVATWDKRILKNIPQAWSGRAVIGWQVAWLDRYWSGPRRCQTRAVVAYIKVLRLLPCFCAPALLFIHVPYSTTIFTDWGVPVLLYKIYAA